jgi:hypothetical protein
MCAFFCVCIQVEALRRVDYPSKESYRLSLIKKLRKLSPMLQKWEQAPKCGSNKEEKSICISISLYMMFLTVLLVCWFKYGSVCGYPECLCWGGNLVYGGRPSRSFVVGFCDVGCVV